MQPSGSAQRAQGEKPVRLHEAFAGVVRPDALSRRRRASLTPRTARPPSLIWRESSERLVCLNDETALVALDHVLEFQVFVPWDEEETAIPPANAQVVQDAHGEALCACTPSAFAEKVKLRGVLSALPKLLFVLGLPSCSLDLGTRHRATQRTRLRRGRRTRHRANGCAPRPTRGRA